MAAPDVDALIFILYVQNGNEHCERLQLLIPKYSRIAIQDVDKLPRPLPSWLTGVPCLVHVHSHNKFYGSDCFRQIEEYTKVLRRFIMIELPKPTYPLSAEAIGPGGMPMLKQAPVASPFSPPVQTPSSYATPAPVYASSVPVPPQQPPSFQTPQTLPPMAYPVPAGAMPLAPPGAVPITPAASVTSPSAPLPVTQVYQIPVAPPPSFVPQPPPEPVGGSALPLPPPQTRERGGKLMGLPPPDINSAGQVPIQLPPMRPTVEPMITPPAPQAQQQPAQSQQQQQQPSPSAPAFSPQPPPPPPPQQQQPIQAPPPQPLQPQLQPSYQPFTPNLEAPQPAQIRVEQPGRSVGGRKRGGGAVSNNANVPPMPALVPIQINGNNNNNNNAESAEYATSPSTSAPSD